jgi:hypothetical protein
MPATPEASSTVAPGSAGWATASTAALTAKATACPAISTGYTGRSRLIAGPMKFEAP